MKKKVFGRKLKRDINERKALFKSLVSSLVLYGRIQTTEEKAKAIKSHVDKLVTKTKKNGQRSKNLLQKYLSSDATAKMIQEVAPLFVSRNGGYNRIIRTGRRLSDNASMVIMEWTEQARSLQAADNNSVKGSKRKKETKEGEVSVEKGKASKSTKKTQEKPVKISIKTKKAKEKK